MPIDYEKLLRVTVAQWFESEGTCWSPDFNRSDKIDPWGEKNLDADLTKEECEAMNLIVEQESEAFDQRIVRRMDMSHRNN
jgi:hypothetical protein